MNENHNNIKITPQQMKASLKRYRRYSNTHRPMLSQRTSSRWVVFEGCAEASAASLCPSYKIQSKLR